MELVFALVFSFGFYSGYKAAPKDTKEITNTTKSYNQNCHTLGGVNEQQKTESTMVKW